MDIVFQRMTRPWETPELIFRVFSENSRDWYAKKAEIEFFFIKVIHMILFQNFQCQVR